jgi:predicted negative regulator of RcsB-dependent stress response
VARKYTRKQLRQPDAYITMSNRVAEWVKLNAKLFVVSLVVAIVIVGAFWGWTAYQTSRARKATRLINRATEIYHQAVIPGAEEVKREEGDIPRFKTQAAKLKATIEELDKAVDKFKSRSIGSVAIAMRAAARYDQGKYKEAIEDYRKVLDAFDDQDLRVRLREGLIYCHEGLKQWDQALAQVQKLPQKGEHRYLALYHEARILAAQGKPKEARERLNEVLKKTASPTLKRQAGQRLALLQAP